MELNNRNVFILGAGFSVPAKLPIQNRIINEIVKSEPKDSFLEYEPAPESIKFMTSFIRVGLYLLKNYTNDSYDEYEKTFTEIERNIQDSEILQSTYDDCYKEVQILREKIRSTLEAANLQISLEDIFTSFDKSYISKEYLNQYSYYQANEIKDSIMSLFVYYFSKCINEHPFNMPEYLSFCNHIKSLKKVSIISTNWDVLVEEYFERKKIPYNLCLNESYFKYSPHWKSESKKSSKNTVNLIKLHGSINWFKCLHCGTLNIVNHKDCGGFLFDDSPEQCIQCQEKRKLGLLLQPEFITPTMIKSINSQLYNNLWSAAKKDLRKAKKIVFIGYSLPIADFEIRYLLQQSIPPGIPIDVVLHSDDSPTSVNSSHLKSLLPEKRFRDLFVKNELNFFYNGFDSYFKHIDNSLGF